MIIKVDGIENKELGKNPVSLMKFLKENTHSGKVEPIILKPKTLSSGTV